MNSRFLARVILISWALLALAPIRAVMAESSFPYQDKETVLRLDPLPTFAIGNQPVLTVHLTTKAGEPLGNRLIRVFAYNNRHTEGLTDPTGTAHIPLRFNYYPGNYDLLAAFDGSAPDHLASSFSRTVLTMVLGSLEVQTVPPIPGVRFIFNDQTATTDASGTVKFSVDHVDTYHIQIQPPAQSGNPNVKYAFDRWSDNDVSVYHEIAFPVNRPLQAGFLVDNQVNLKYMDQVEQPVDAARISAARIRAAGMFYALANSPTSVWLPTNHILHRVGGVLQSEPAIYYIDDVTIAGANVVNQGQQRFLVTPGITWPIHLFLYPATFTAHDALFRNPLGTGILLQYPDGARQQLAFDPGSKRVQLNSLPRGIYRVSVQGAPGLEPSIPLSLSHAGTFDMNVISRLDLAILLGVPLLVALILLVIGRTNAFAWLAPQRRAS
ncbi:MAG TPA: hypothetical protein VF784_02345 [Anaerolineales bacterium]